MKDILLRISKIADNEGITITGLERKIGASKGVLSRALLKIQIFKQNGLLE